MFGGSSRSVGFSVDVSITLSKANTLGSNLAPLQYPSFYLSHIISRVAVNLQLKFFYMCIDMCMNNLTNETMGIEWKTYALFQISYTILINISTKTAISVLGGLVVMMLIWIVRD